MIKVDCSELSGDTKLALAEAVTEKLGGKGVALLTGDNIAIDELSGRKVETEDVRPLVDGFFSSRGDASAFSVEVKGDTIVVNSREPVTADRKKVASTLPPNVFQCPVCGFVATSKERYEDHLRVHDYIRGLPK